MTFAECEQELGVEWNEVRITRRVFRDGKDSPLRFIIFAEPLEKILVQLAFKY